MTDLRSPQAESNPNAAVSFAACCAKNWWKSPSFARNDIGNMARSAAMPVLKISSASSLIRTIRSRRSSLPRLGLSSHLNPIRISKRVLTKSSNKRTNWCWWTWPFLPAAIILV